MSRSHFQLSKHQPASPTTVLLGTTLIQRVGLRSRHLRNVGHMVLGNARGEQSSHEWKRNTAHAQVLAAQATRWSH